MAKWRLRLFWAALLALVTAWGVHTYLGSLQETEPVLVATREIPARTLVTADMVKTIQVGRKDRDQLAANAFHAAADVTGRYARRAFEAGEVLRNRPGDFTAPGEVRAGASGTDGALADFLPAGSRGETLKLDAQAMLGKHLKAGDRVDVIFTSKSDSTGGVYASLVVQQVLVLDIERKTDGSADDSVLVTVAVTPEQAVELALAKRTGSVDLALNPPDSAGAVNLRVISPLQFTGQTDAPPGKVETRSKETPAPGTAKSGQ
ncbi:MAG TPA: Flp pilus assembly protein CpaB [Symbiobacteriaceae bacterium]|jgi:pilus assembly protein CpaB